jgi:hypothetical protein
LPAAAPFPDWLIILSWSALYLGVGCAALILVDVARFPQHMGIMNVVWPVTALFGTVLVAALYFKYGRNAEPSLHSEKSQAPETPFPIMVAKGTLHCGAGCTLGDVIAETLAFLFPAIAILFGWKTIFADKTYAVWILDFVLAFGLGIVFQYFAIVPMRKLAPLEGLREAFKADALSLICWQIGMYGLMFLAQRYFSASFGQQAKPDSPVFWFAMQIAMVAGFVTSFPANWWLIRAGIKEKM